MKKFFKAFIITLLLVLVLFFGTILFLLLKNHVSDPGEFFDELSNNDSNLTFLLLGVDSLKANEAENTRSDTMMIVNMDMNTGKTNIVSIPRDTYTSIEGYKKQKINHAYNYGGAELSLKTVNNLLGTNIEYYMTIDYKFVEQIVDTIGGVEVDVPMDMQYEDPWADPPLKIDIKAGNQTLNGSEAIQFLRFRKGYADADLSRAKAQQQFVSAFLQKLKQPQSLIKAPVMMVSYDKYTISNIPFAKMVKSGMNIRNFSSENINMTTLPGSPAYKNKVSYFFIDEKATDSLLRQLGLK